MIPIKNNNNLYYTNYLTKQLNETNINPSQPEQIMSDFTGIYGQIDFLKKERTNLEKKVRRYSRRSDSYKACMEKIKMYCDIEQNMYAFLIISRLQSNCKDL